MARRQRLSQRRQTAGLSQEQLAERLGIDRSTVARWEAGKTAPLPWLRPRLADALRVSIEELDALLDVATIPHEGLTDALAHPGRVGLATVASVRQRVHDLDARYDRAPSTLLLADAGQCLGEVSVLRAHTPTGRIRRELCVAEIEAAILMGQLVWDASQRRDHATARGYYNRAAETARRLGDLAAESRALLRMGFVALYGERDPHEGLAMTMRAAGTAEHTSPVLTGLALLHAAEAHAMLGHRRDCERALGAAETRFAQVGGDDAAIDLFSPTQHGRLAGSCYLFLDDARRAQPILEGVARALDDRSKSQAIVLGNLALACIRQGKLEEAAVALHHAIDVVETTWGGGGLTIVFSAARELRRWRTAQVVDEVYDRVLALMATT